MSLDALVNSEKRHMAAMKAAFPATLRFSSGRTCGAAIVARRGVRFEENGGTIQEKKLTCLVESALLPESEIIDAATDATRPRTFTHLQTGRIYLLKTDGEAPQLSPQGIFWKITGTQTTTRA